MDNAIMFCEDFLQSLGKKKILFDPLKMFFCCYFLHKALQDLNQHSHQSPLCFILQKKDFSFNCSK